MRLCAGRSLVGGWWRVDWRILSDLLEGDGMARGSASAIFESGSAKMKSGSDDESGEIICVRIKNVWIF